MHVHTHDHSNNYFSQMVALGGFGMDSFYRPDKLYEVHAHTHTTILQPLYSSTCVSQHPQ